MKKTHFKAILLLIVLSSFQFADAGEGPAHVSGTLRQQVNVYYNCPNLGGIINVVLTNTSTSAQSFFYITDEGTGTLGTVEEGIYDVVMYEGSSYSFSACGQSTSGTSASFESVMINHDCSTLSAIHN